MRGGDVMITSERKKPMAGEEWSLIDELAGD